VSGTDPQAKSEDGEFVSLVVSARLACRPLLLLLYVFDWGLQSSLEKLILELNASDVDEQRVRDAGLRFRINYLLELPTKVRLNNPERPAVVCDLLGKFLTVGRGTACQQAN